MTITEAFSAVGIKRESHQDYEINGLKCPAFSCPRCLGTLRVKNTHNYRLSSFSCDCCCISGNQTNFLEKLLGLSYYLLPRDDFDVTDWQAIALDLKYRSAVAMSKDNKD